MKGPIHARLRACLAVVGLVTSTLSLSAAAEGAPSAPLRIETLSNRADLVSGGDVLLRIRGVAYPNGVTIARNGQRLKGALHRDAGGPWLFAYLTGLRVGKNTITVSARGQTAALDVTNHPAGGPVFSGPQVRPWRCTTAENGLGTPLDDQCNVVTSYDYQYWSTEEGNFQPYDPSNPPADVAQTTTDEGFKVPYIVRREFGAINRGLYGIAVLFDPAKKWTPWSQQNAWNNKLFYPFGASCNTNYTQGNTDSFNVLVDEALSKGFAVATSSLNTLGQNCNTITSAETVMMVKERVVEQYGEIRYTFGRGGSGGSIGQLVVANAYPGLLNGLLPSHLPRHMDDRLRGRRLPPPAALLQHHVAPLVGGSGAADGGERTRGRVQLHGVGSTFRPRRRPDARLWTRQRLTVAVGLGPGDGDPDAR